MMNKFLHFRGGHARTSSLSRHSILAFLLLFLTSFVGVGNAWGATATIQGNCWGTTAQSYQDGPKNFTDEQGNTWTATGYGVTANTAVIIGKGGANYLETPEFEGNITSIKVTWSGITSYYLALKTVSGTELEAKQNPSTATEATFTITGSHKQLRLVGRRLSDTKNAAATITKVVVNYEDATPSDPFTVTLMDNGTTLTEISAGDGVVLPSRTGCAGYTFAGWTKTWNSEQAEWTTTAPTIINAGDYTPTADENLYPVYTKTEEGGVAFSQYSKVNHGGTITEGKYLISTGSYTMAGSGKTGASFTPGQTEAITKEYTIHLLGNGVFTILGPDNKYVGGKDANDGLLFDASEPTANSYKWKYTSNGIQNQQYTSRYLKAYSTSDFRHYASGSGVLTYLYKRVEEASSTTYYISEPNCCQPLAQINGSVPEIHPTSAVVKLASAYSDAANADAYQLKIEGSSNYNTWMDVDKANLTTSTGVTVNGLTCGTEYTAYLRAKGSGNYCEFGTESSVNFTTSKYSVSIADLNNGTITANPTSACADETVTLTVTPNDGYHLDSWSLNGEPQNINPLSFTMPAENVTISATFEENSVPMAINVTETDKATVTSSAESSLAGETITLTCTDIEEGYQFFGWIVTAGGNPVEVTNPTSATEASFKMPAAAVTITADIRQMVTVTFKRNNEIYASQSTYLGGTVTFPENPTKFDNNYPHFVGWAEAIEGIATSAPTLKSESEVINAGITYHAVFANEPVVTNDYKKISTLGELTSGNYLIVSYASSKYFAMKNEVQSSYYVAGTVVTPSADIISNPAAANIFALSPNADAANGLSIYNATSGKYVGVVYTNSHYNLKPNESSAHYFTYSVDGSASWTITSKTYTSSHILYNYYNSSTPEFLVEGSYANPIYLFKQEVASSEWITKQIVKHTISYNKNTEDEVTGSLPANAIVVDGEDYTVSEATLSREGYNFVGWNTDKDAISDMSSLSGVTEDKTLYAIWYQIPRHDVQFSVNGSVVNSLTKNLLEGASVVFPDATAITDASAFPTTDKKFVGWIEDSSYASDEAPTFVTSATATADKTYYAVFADQIGEGGYNKLTSTEGLVAGDKIVVTNGSSVGMKAYGQTSDNNFKGTAIEIEGNQITNLGEACELTLGGTEGHWTLFDGAKYVYAAGSAKSSGSGYNNYMKGKDTKDAACEWTISIDGETTTIKSVENTATSYMRYNSTNTSVFSCYNTASQNAVVLFKKSANIYEDYVTTIAALDHISITAAPTKTVYKKGEALDVTGMVVTATYGTGESAHNKVLASGSYSIDLSGALETTNTKFTVTYKEKTAEQEIAVVELDHIAISAEAGETIKDNYYEGDSFDATHMVVTATWGTEEGKTISEAVTGYTITPTTLNSIEINQVTISYTHENVEKSEIFNVTVSERQNLVMTWKVGNAEPTTSKIYINNDDKYLLVLPEETPDPVAAGFTSDFVFKGWTSDETIAKSGENIHFAEAGNEMSVATTFRAVFAQGEENEVEVFNETFASCDGTGGNDGSWNGSIASKTTPEALTSTWTLQNSNAASGCLKLGSSSNTASAKTPSIDCGSAASATLTFKAGAWDNNDDGTTLSLTYTNCSGNKASVTMNKGAWTSYEVELTNISGEITIQFASTTGSKHRFFLDEVVVTKNVTNYSNFRFAPSVVATPVIELEAGTYYGAQEVSITAEKAIYYTLDGTNPDKNSIAYNSVINLNEAGTKTLKAVAYDSENDDYSAIVSAEYTIVTEIAAPTMPATGKFFEDSKEVTIEHALTAEGAKIYYSYDDASYSEYSTSLNITETTIVWAYATIGSLTSDKVSATYTKGETVTYTKVTSAEGLVAGMEFVLVAENAGSYYGAGALNSSYLEKVDLIAPVGNVLSITNQAIAVFTLGGEPEAWTMTSEEGTLYSNDEKNVNYSNGNDKWDISYQDGQSTIANTKGNLLYNATSPRFTTYSSTQKAVSIYARNYAPAYTVTYKNGETTVKSIKTIAGYEHTISNAPAGEDFCAWTDGTNYYQAGDQIIVNDDITLTAAWRETLRGELREGKWGTYCPDHNVKYPAGATFYTLTYKEVVAGQPYKVFFDEVEPGAALVGGKPYLFIAEGEAIKGVKVGAAANLQNYNGFTGVLSNYTLEVTAGESAAYKYYIVYGNEIRLCGAGQFYVPAERAYLDMSQMSSTPVAPAPGRRRISLVNHAAETATGMENVQGDNVQCTKVLINGELFILRGEKMYDAKGQLVK